MQLSIVVPVLNEAAGMRELLAHLQAFVSQGCELVLVDGGSDDGSPELARQAGWLVLCAPRGRARQMNAGAAHSHGEVLLFLHADTRLPPDALARVLQALAPPRRHWGRFDVVIEGQHPMLRVIAWFMNRRSRLSGIATGDQALFMTRASFDRMGGFPDQPLMEDIEMSCRLNQLSRPVCLRQRAVTSGRRWESRGVWRTIWLMWRLRWRYWRGDSAEVLAQAYR